MNIFSVLDESDEEEQPKVVDKKLKEVAKKETGAKKDTPAAAKPAAKAPEAKKDAAPAKDAKPKPANDKPAKAANDKAPKTAAPAAAATTEEDGTTGKDNNRGGHARGRDNKAGRGRGHGVPESADGQTRVKREFDRRSGTGRGREVSKGGRGAFGFGNPAQDAQEAEKDPNAAEAILEPVDGTEEAAEPEVPAEPEPVVFGLDEYLEKRNEQRKALLAKETKLRVVDQSSLAGLTRKEEESDNLYMAEKVKAAKAEATKKEQRSTGKTQVLDIAFKFESVKVDDDSDRRGGRGGRGGAREGGRGGGRGRGSNTGRGARPSSGGNANKPVTVFNSLDFPSL